MSPDPLLAVLYDLSQVIGSEKRLQPLLTRVLQRLLFHTALPAGVALLGKPGERMAECVAVVGEPSLASSHGKWLTVPDSIIEDQCGWLPREVLAALCLHGRWEQALRLPIPGSGVFLLLLPLAASGRRPEMGNLLMPAMHTLGPAVTACRMDEESRLLLSRDRDQARQDLAIALRESQEHLRLLRKLSDTLPDMIWLKSIDGRYLFGNKALCEFVGCEPGQLIGRTDADLFDAAMASCFAHQDMATGLGDGLKVFEQSVHDHRSGRTLLLQVSKTMVSEGQDTPIGIMGIARDITQQRARDRELRQAASVFTHAREGIMITTPDGAIVDVNQAFSRITGYAREEVIGQNPRLFHSGRQEAVFYRRMWQSMADQGYWSGELWNRRRNGEIYPQQMTITAVHDEAGTLQQYVALVHDVSEQKAYEQQLRHAAHFDALTGLPNRVLLGEMMAEQTLHAQQHGLRMAVAYLDLDGFKDINDAHGHAVGDAFLFETAQRMAGCLVEGDVLARIGGDEFIVLLNDVGGIEQARQRVDTLLPAASGKVVIEGHALQVTVSIGLALDRGDGRIDAELLVRQADHAMYQAKLQGKNRCCLFEAESEREMRSRQEQFNEIRQGLAGNEFILHYQPKVNMRTGALLGVEALVRWQHPRSGLLMPDQFLPLIEHHELAEEMGAWVLRNALAQTARWHAEGQPLQVSVNIGARHLQQASFLSALRQMLAGHPGLPAALLQLEIVETSALDDIEHASSLLQACAGLGISSAIDDFGTGYSSLSYLKRLPVQCLKVDKSFVSEMLENPDDLAILEGIIGLARAFDREVLAEGVESEDHGILLLQLGCERGQGYGIARPMPAQALAQWRAQWSPPVSWSSAMVTAVGEVTLMRICIYLRAWLKHVGDYVAGVSDTLPEMDASHCLFTRWVQRSEVEASIAPTLLAMIHEQHHRMHELGQALVAALPQMGSAHFQDLHQQLRDHGKAVIDDLMQRAHVRWREAAAATQPGQAAAVA